MAFCINLTICVLTASILEEEQCLCGTDKLLTREEEKCTSGIKWLVIELLFLKAGASSTFESACWGFRD